MRNDEFTDALGEAMFRARYSDPNSEAVDRAWTAISSQDGYRAAIVREQLRKLGFDVVQVAEA